MLSIILAHLIKELMKMENK